MENKLNKNPNPTTTTNTYEEENDNNGTNTNAEVYEVAKASEVRVIVTRCASIERMVSDSEPMMESQSLNLSESDSDVSLITVASKASRTSTTGQRKRRRYSEGGIEEDKDEYDEEDMTPLQDILHRSRSGSGRGRGRPATTGDYVGLAAAQTKLNEAKAEAIRLEAEAQFAEELRQKELKSAASYRKSPTMTPTSNLGMEQETPDSKRRILDSVETIQKVAKTSSNLKGTYVRALKDAADAIMVSFKEMRTRTMSEEVARLETANARLAFELDKMRKELAEVRAAQIQPATVRPPEPSRASQPVTEDMMREIMIQVGTMINARFEGVQDRLLPEKRLRPPLAADRRREAEAAAASGHSQVTPAAPPLPQAQSKKAAKKAKAKAKNSAAATTVPTERGAPQPKEAVTKDKAGSSATTAATGHTALINRPPAPPTEAWTEVVKRGSRPKKRAAQPANARVASTTRTGPTKPAPQKRPQTKQKTVKLRPPRTAAVVITLQPGAAEKGMTYAQVITEAKARIDLGALGMPPLKIRTTTTGARILEVPGAEKTEKADSLAEKLREVFQNSEDVRVSRPTITADLRVSGLDDSVTTTELVEALAKAGACDPSAIKAGDIRKGPAGMGTAFIRAPLAAAKKLTANGNRLLVGWVSAQIRLLEARPRRCYRCLELGHVRAQCTNEMDRSDECYRCGQKGHKANSCSAAPHCTLCSAAGKPADHLSGGKACAKPPSKKGARRRRAATEAKAKSQPPRSVTEPEERMEES